jgi:hypothetical protein
LYKIISGRSPTSLGSPYLSLNFRLRFDGHKATGQNGREDGAFVFEGSRLDPANALFWREDDRVVLAPKPFEVH